MSSPADTRHGCVSARSPASRAVLAATRGPT
jgi:hypothetical protein